MSVEEQQQPSIADIHDQPVAEEMTARLGQTLTTLKGRVAATTRDAQQQLQAHPVLPQTKAAASQAWINISAMREKRAEIATNPGGMLSKAGIQQAQAEATAKTRESYEKTKAASAALIAQLRQTDAVQARTAPAIAKQVFWAKTQEVRRIDTLRDGEALVARAMDPRTSATEAEEITDLLEDCYLPVCERAHLAPRQYERHLSGVAGQLAAAIRTHVDAVRGVSARQARIDLADALESQWQWLDRAVDDPNVDEFLLKVGAPALFGAPSFGRNAK